MEISEESPPVTPQPNIDESLVMEGIDDGNLNLSLASLPSSVAFESVDLENENEHRKSASLGVDEVINLEGGDELEEERGENVEESESGEEVLYARRRGGIIRKEVRRLLDDPESRVPAKLTVAAALLAKDGPRSVMYPTMRARPDRKRVAFKEREPIVSILTSESSGDEARDYILKTVLVTRNSYGQGISIAEKESLTRHVKMISRLDPHTMRPVAYRPIRAQEFHEFDLHMANIPWYTDLSQFGTFQSTVLTQWPAHYYKPRFDRFRRSESRFVHSTDPVSEDLIFENSTVLGLPLQIKAGTAILYQNLRLPKPVDSPETWTLPYAHPTIPLEFPFEDEPPPLVRSIMPNQDTCDDFLPERTGMVDDEYEGSAILGGDRAKYSAPYLEEQDIQLIEKMEGEIKAHKRSGFAIPKHFSGESLPFESLIKRALPAAEPLFYMAPTDTAQDRETVDDHVTILQSLSHALEDSWQTILDHYTRVERRNRRHEREKARSEQKVPNLAPNGHKISATGGYRSKMDQEGELMLVDEDDMLMEGIEMQNDEMDVTKASDWDDSMPNGEDESEEADHGMGAYEAEDEGALADNEDENGEPLNGSDDEIHQDITSHVEITPSELLKQYEGESVDDWVARLACIIGESFYRFTMSSDDLENAVDAAVAEQEAVVDEQFGVMADLEVINDPENPKPEIEPIPDSVIVMEDGAGGTTGKEKRVHKKRGKKRKHENSEAVLAEGFGESTITSKERRRGQKGGSNRANWMWREAKANIPDPAPLEPFKEEDLAPLPLMWPFRVSRPTHEFLTSEVASLLNDVLDGLLVQAGEVYKERDEKKPRIDTIHAITRSHEIVVNELMRVCDSREMRQAFERKCELLFLNHDFQKLWPRGTKDSITRHKFFTSRPLNPYQLVPRFSRSRKADPKSQQGSGGGDNDDGEGLPTDKAPPMPWEEACEIVKCLTRNCAKFLEKKQNAISNDPTSSSKVDDEPNDTSQALPSDPSTTIPEEGKEDSKEEIQRLRSLPIPSHFIMPPIEKTYEIDKRIYLRDEDDDAWTKEWKLAMNRAHRFQRLKYSQLAREAEKFVLERQNQTKKGVRIQDIPESLLPFLTTEFIERKKISKSKRKNGSSDSSDASISSDMDVDTNSKPYKQAPESQQRKQRPRIQRNAKDPNPPLSPVPPSSSPKIPASPKSPSAKAKRSTSSTTDKRGKNRK